MLPALALALLLPAAAPAAQPRPDEGSPIIVEGTKSRDEQIRQFVKDLTPAPVRGQLARFEAPVCPVVLGVADTQAKAIEDRMREVAAAAGIPVAKPGCMVNIALFVTPDKAALLHELERWPGMFPQDWSQGRLNQLKRDPSPVAAWQTESMIWESGLPVDGRQSSGFEGSVDGLYMHGTATRLKPAARPVFVKSVIVIQANALEGLTPTEVADYAAMRSFVRVDPGQLRRSPGGSILSIMDAPMGSPVPVTLTEWDLGFLKSFYASTRDMYVEYQRAQMAGEMKRELEQDGSEGR